MQETPVWFLDWEDTLEKDKVIWNINNELSFLLHSHDLSLLTGLFWEINEIKIIIVNHLLHANPRYFMNTVSKPNGKIMIRIITTIL